MLAIDFNFIFFEKKEEKRRKKRNKRTSKQNVKKRDLKKYARSVVYKQTFHFDPGPTSNPTAPSNPI